jgi:Ca-activated chloride channel family protein
MEGMARAGQGEPFIVLRPEKAAAEAEKLRAYIEQPVLTGVNVAFSGFDAYEVAPQKLPDLMARRPLVLFGKYRGSAGGRIEVKGTSGGGPLRQVVEVRPSDVRAENAALRWLWARRWVELLDDERAMGAGQPAEDGITTLGLDYHLLTAFTSFVAIDSQVVNAGGQGKNVRQPLPMPEGVSNLAVEQPTAAVAPMGVMGSSNGYGSGGGAYRHAGKAGAPIMPAPPPGPKQMIADNPLAGLDRDESRRSRPAPAKEEAKEEKTADKKHKDDGDSKPASPTWIVTAANSATVGPAAPLLQAISAALTSGRAACLVPSSGKPIKVRLTLDARGAIVRVELVTGDRNAESCLRAALAGLSSSTQAKGAPTGTIEVTMRVR